MANLSSMSIARKALQVYGSDRSPRIVFRRSFHPPRLTIAIWRSRPTAGDRYILFTSVRSGAPQIWRMEIDGSNPVQLTGGGDAQMSDVSPDGEWAFYTSRGIWKVPVAGGEPVALPTSHSAGYPSVSPDGKFIAYYYREKQPGAKFKIAVTPSGGGQPAWTFVPPREDFWTFDIRWTT